MFSLNLILEVPCLWNSCLLQVGIPCNRHSHDHILNTSFVGLLEKQVFCSVKPFVSYCFLRKQFKTKNFDLSLEDRCEGVSLPISLSLYSGKGVCRGSPHKFENVLVGFYSVSKWIKIIFCFKLFSWEIRISNNGNIFHEHFHIIWKAFFEQFWPAKALCSNHINFFTINSHEEEKGCHILYRLLILFFNNWI